MATFDKTTNVRIRMAVGDLTAVSISPNGYNPSLNIQMRDNESVEISIEGEGLRQNQDFVTLVNCIIEAAVSANWNERYGSGVSYASSPRKVTVDQIVEWITRDKEEADVEATLKMLDTD